MPKVPKHRIRPISVQSFDALRLAATPPVVPLPRPSRMWSAAETLPPYRQFGQPRRIFGEARGQIPAASVCCDVDSSFAERLSGQRFPDKSPHRQTPRNRNRRGGCRRLIRAACTCRSCFPRSMVIRRAHDREPLTGHATVLRARAVHGPSATVRGRRAARSTGRAVTGSAVTGSAVEGARSTARQSRSPPLPDGDPPANSTTTRRATGRR